MPQPAPDAPSAGSAAGSALPRRAVLGGLAAGALVAVAGGCTAGSPQPDADASGGTATTPPREVSPDVALAVSAVERIGRVADLLDRTVAHHRRLRHPLAGLAALHAAHLRLLRQAVPDDQEQQPGAGTRRPRGAPHDAHAALRSVLHAERSLRPQLEGLAVRAESGEFARLLAAMSAAVGQQLAVVAR